ncbi:hypothetical protein [Streptomyces sp. SudanB148_2056]|uniref:hypothetical protein n=1 Tax=Streptomyces sp. SudanB148_2056 TaxID=3035280 RepID=UPI003F57EC53
MDVSPFKPAVVKATFSHVTWMHVPRPAVRVAASVTRTLLTGIIQGAKATAADERCTVIQPRHLVAAIHRNVEVDVSDEWYDHSPAFRALTGDAKGAAVRSGGGGRARRRTPSAMAGAHRFEPAVRRPAAACRARSGSAMPSSPCPVRTVKYPHLLDDRPEVRRAS